MKRIFFFLIFLNHSLFAGVLINEISAGGGDDWVELKATENISAIDIASFYVTMYYGSNEKIATAPVTLRGKDISDTPFDDRYAIIHFTSEQLPDETDDAGDINKNGIRDLYCNNYGLWNTDCVVAIDSDDNPDNGGMLDFVAFSNRDGSLNSTIAGYMKSASESGQWILCQCAELQDCMSFVGENGLKSSTTLARRNVNDSDSPEDFIITPYATPGMDNIFQAGGKGRKILITQSGRITFRAGKNSGSIPVKFIIYEPCSIKIRIFNSAGLQVYVSDSVKAEPGYFTVNLESRLIKGKKLTGLYPVRIEYFTSDRSGETTVPLVIINGK